MDAKFRLCALLICGCLVWQAACSPAPRPTAVQNAGSQYPAPVSGPGPTAYPGEQLPAPQAAIPTPDILSVPPALTGKVVFHAGAENAHNIFVVDLATSQQMQLTIAGDNVEPAWSPDGTQIAYACKPDKSFGICVMQADGTNSHPLVTGAFQAWGPNWSPDGQQLAYVSSETPYAHVYILDLASGKSRRLLNSPGNEAGPRWSPDGAKIIFMSDRNNHFNLYVAGADGSGEKQLTDFGWDDRPAWSPDGKKITFRRQVESASTYSGNEIMIADADGQNIQRLTYNMASDDWPTFSPDGKWIIYSSLKGGTAFIQVVPVGGGMSAPLTVGGRVGYAPHWKP